MRSQRSLRLICAAAALMAMSAVAASAQPQPRVEFRDGRVSIAAEGVPLQQLLKAWEEGGGTSFLYADRLPDAPVTLTIAGATEAEALAEILKGAVGYVARMRTAAGPGQSRFTYLAILAESDLRDGGAAVRRALDEAERRGRTQEVGGRPVSLEEVNVILLEQPASPGDPSIPPRALPEDDRAALEKAGHHPSVNPIPAGLPAPPVTPLDTLKPAEGQQGAAGTQDKPGAAKPDPKAQPPKPIKKK